MSGLLEFFASTDNALRMSLVLALHGLALFVAGALALVVATSAAHELGGRGPRWRWFGWFALAKGMSVIASLALGVAYGWSDPGFFKQVYLACTLPAWLAGANFAWSSWRARPAWATTRLPTYLWCGGVGVVGFTRELPGLELLARGLAVAVGTGMLITLGGEIRALDKGGRARAAFSLLLVMAGLAGLIAMEAVDEEFATRFQGWTVNTLGHFVRGDFTPILLGTGFACALAAGWWSWMRLHVQRFASRGWLRRALWLIPVGQLVLCLTGFVLLNHLKLDGSARADRIFAARARTALLGLTKMANASALEPGTRREALALLAAANPDFESLTLAREEGGALVPVVSAGRGSPAAGRVTLWRARGADDPRLAARPRKAFATTFLSDTRGTHTLFLEPWPGPDADWLVVRVSFREWSEVMGQVLSLAAIIILLACVLGVAVVVFLIQRELGAETGLDLARASAANEAKTEFLSRASHELRTPIQGVLGYADLLGRSPLNSRQASWLDSLRTQGGHLLSLVNDLLDFGALQNGRLPLEARPVSPARIAREALDAVRPQAETRGLDCSLTIEPGTPAWVRGDPVRLRQILVNLLGNAVKFTAEGSVRLRVNARERPEADGRRRLLFAVADTGAGISAEDLPRIFEPRGRARRHPAEGAGLGLALTRSLCRAMGGDLAVESTPEEGSVFTASVLLPAAEGPETLRGSGPRRLPALGQRVLVVEDNVALRALLGDWLDELGCATVLAPDGEEALALAREQDFDAVVLDLGLPGIDGREVARRLRARPTPPGATRPRIVGLSAHAGEEDRLSALAAGMDLFLTKPVELAALAAALRGQNPSIPAGFGSSPPMPLHASAGSNPPMTASPAGVGEGAGLGLGGRDASTTSGGLLASPLLTESRAQTIRALARQDLTARRDELRDAIGAGDWPRVAKVAHYLANTADLLGDAELRSACVACEDAALEGDTARARSAARAIMPGSS